MQDVHADNLPTQSQGGAAILPDHGPRRHLPETKCPCEERVGGKLCRKESISMTALGKLLCPEHTEAYESKWNLKLSRLQLMA